jgi:putative oxidoreductase
LLQQVFAGLDWKPGKRRVVMKNIPVRPDLGILVIRLWIGFIGIFHGSQKLFGLFGGKGIAAFADSLEQLNVPMPVPSAWAAGIAEFGGGLLVAIGLLSRIGAIPLIFTMLVAYFVAHKGKFVATASGGEYALTIAIVLIGLIIAGPGKYAVTRRI